MISTSAVASSDEPDTFAHVDRIDRSIVILPRGGALSRLGTLKSVIDRLQSAWHVTVEYAVAARPAGIVNCMSTQMFQSMSLLAARSIKQAGGRNVPLRRRFLEQPVQQRGARNRIDGRSPDSWGLPIRL